MPCNSRHITPFILSGKEDGTKNCTNAVAISVTLWSSLAHYFFVFILTSVCASPVLNSSYRTNNPIFQSLSNCYFLKTMKNTTEQHLCVKVPPDFFKTSCFASFSLSKDGCPQFGYALAPFACLVNFVYYNALMFKQRPFHSEPLVSRNTEKG